MTPESTFSMILYSARPAAIARLKGSPQAPQLNGHVKFYTTPFNGVLIQSQIFGLPGKNNYYAMHIHEKGDCTPPFNDTGMHYNPTNEPHPFHAGDLAPILSNHGYAYSVMFTTRFDIDDIIGRSVIIHINPDDFTTQPSGNSGDKIGCGVILKM